MRVGRAEIGEGCEPCSAHLGVFACCVRPPPIQDGMRSPIPRRVAEECAGRGAELFRQPQSRGREECQRDRGDVRDRLELFEESGRATSVGHFRVDERRERQRRHERLRISDFSSRGNRLVCVAQGVLELIARELDRCSAPTSAMLSM